MAHFENPRKLGLPQARPKAEILTVGTELLTGSSLNTNAGYLGRRLTQLGFEVFRQVSCRDEEAAIHNAIREAMDPAEILFVTGGLGPTPDDVTRASIASFFKVPLVLSQRQYRRIRLAYGRKGEGVPEMVRQEAYFPKGALPLFNRYGIALGFMLERAGKPTVVLPGVPSEMERLFENQVVPILRRKFYKAQPPFCLVVKTLGLSEPAIMKRLGSGFFKMGRFQFGIYPEVAEVSIRIYGDSQPLLRRLKRHMKAVLGEAIYSFRDETLEAAVGKRLYERRWTLGIAESCTGGLLAREITRVPGASGYFLGGVTAYQNEVKSRLLGVTQDVLGSHGAVSEEVAGAMARGARRLFKSTLGISVTGIAGPEGGSHKKPVGLVFISIASGRSCSIWQERFGGDREQIQIRAARKALAYLWQWLRKSK